MIRAVTYCRCSTEEESQQDALQQQVIESQKSVQKQGWFLLDEYIEAKSGTTTAKRDEYNRLFDDLQTDKFDVVVIKSQDRLMRNTRDWYLFVDRLVSNGKRLYMYLEGKFYSADDALITGIKAILAEEYSKELSKKINNAHYHRQQDGRGFILPPQTYGLKKNENGDVVLVEEEAAAIRIMFLLCKTMGCISIAHYMEQNNFRDRNNKRYKEEAIRRIIRNPIRCGTIIQNKRHFDFQTKKTVNVPKEQWVIHKNAVPAIVSEREWQEANEAMDKRSNKGNEKDSAKGRNQGKYRLSGKILCGECGSPYYRRYRKRYGNKKLIIEWKCQKYIQNGRNHAELRVERTRKVNQTTGEGCDNIHLEEERLLHLLEDVFVQNDVGTESDYNRLADKMMSILWEVLGQDDSTRLRNKLQKEHERYEQQIQKLLNKLLEEVISDGDYKSKRKELEKKIDAINQQLNHLKNAGNTQLILEQRLKTIRKRLEADIIKQAFVVDMIDSIETITVFPAKLMISYKSGKPRTEVLLEPDFLYATRKEAENKRILEHMRVNPSITAGMIAEKEGISLSCANARIRRLKAQGKIYFDGKGGHGKWVSCKEL